MAFRPTLADGLARLTVDPYRKARAGTRPHVAIEVGVEPYLFIDLELWRAQSTLSKSPRTTDAGFLTP